MKKEPAFSKSTRVFAASKAHNWSAEHLEDAISNIGSFSEYQTLSRIH